MEQFILWCGFAGAWLLVAGPVYQAALELNEQEFRREELENIAATTAEVDRVSPWWWLLPPVYYVLWHRQQERYRAQVLSNLTPEQLESLMTYLNKAIGWLMVGLGGTFIAVKETWEVCEHYEWPMTVFWPIVVVVFMACLLLTAIRASRTKSVLARTEAESAAENLAGA